jgi:putative transposase
MTNHVHLLITPMSENSISQMMQALGGSYVKYINSTYKRSGTLWEGSFKASLIDSDIYLLACMCYIELNPVRAGLVKHPGEYKWSSYQQNAQRPDTDFIENHQIFSMLGETNKERQFFYRG